LSGDLKSLGPYIRRSLGLLLFNRVPYLSAGTNPHRRSNLRMVNTSCDAPNPHCRFAPLAGRCVSGCRHLLTLTSDFSPNVYSQQTPLPSHWSLPSPAKLEPLRPFPLPLRLIKVHCWRRCRGASDFPRPIVTLFLCTPFEIHTSRTNLGLGIRLMVDGPSPLTSPSHLS